MGFISMHGGDKEEDEGERSSFSCCSPTWLSTFFPDHNDITALPFRTLLASKEDEDSPLGLVSGWLGKVPFSPLDIANFANYSLIVLIILSFESFNSLIILSMS